MRIWILGVVILLSGCSSFGRGVAEAILESGEKKDTRQCEIKGSKFNGIDYFFSEGNTVKVMMIHGVGTHNPGYATRIRENLAQRLSPGSYVASSERHFIIKSGRRQNRFG